MPRRRPSRSSLLALLMGVTMLLLGACVTVTETGEVAPDDVQTANPQQPENGSGSGSGEGYRFLHTTDDGEPVRWSTCEPIRYVIRPDGQPDGAQDVVRDATRRLSEATGLEFSYAGTTDEAPSNDRPLYQPERYGDEWAPVLVAWADAEEYPRLQGQAAGYGGPVYVQPGVGTPRYVSGMAVVDIEGVATQRGGEALRAVVLHELAHVIGLGHVQDRGQLMNPVQYGEEVTEFQSGDLEGLQLLGEGECYDPVDPSRFAP